MSASSQNPGDSFVKNLGERLGADGTPGPQGAAAPAKTSSGGQSSPPLPPMDHPPGGFDDFEPTMADPHAAAPYPGGAPHIPHSDVHSVGAHGSFPMIDDDLDDEPTRMEQASMIPEEPTSILDTRPAPPILSVLSGKDQGKTFVLQQGENGVGRSIDNDVILTDISVSRRHLTLVRDAERVRIVDLGSGNGTQVNGQKVANQPLRSGDQIALGETVLVLQIPGAAAAPVLPLAPAGSVPPPGMFAGPPPAGFASLPPGTPTLPPGAPPPGLSRGLPTDQVTIPDSRPRAARPKWLFPAIAAAAVLLLTLTALVTVLLLSSDEDPVADNSTIEEFNAGNIALNDGDFSGAARHFSNVVQLDPEDARAQELLAEATQARNDEATLAEAQAAFDARDYAAALLKLDEIGADSRLRASAVERREQVVEGRIGELVASANRKLSAEDRGGAELDHREARNLDPADERVVALARTLEALTGATDNPQVVAQQAPTQMVEPRNTPPVRPNVPSQNGRPTPIMMPVMSNPTMEPAGDSGARAQALAAYRGRDFAGASRLARRGASRARGEERQRLTTLAGNIDAFAQAYGDCQVPIGIGLRPPTGPNGRWASWGRVSG